MRQKLVYAAAASVLLIVSAPSQGYDDPQNISSDLARCSGVLDVYGDVVEGLGKPSSGEILRGRANVFGLAAFVLLLDENKEFGREFAPAENQESVDSEADKGRTSALSKIEFEQWDELSQSLRDCTAMGEQYSSILRAAISGSDHEDKYGSPSRWVSVDRKYTALFLVTPQVVSAPVLGGEAISYQSGFEYESGSALFSITEMRIPDGGLAAGEKEFVRQTHRAFAEFLGADTDSGLVEWRPFDNLGDRMMFEIEYDSGYGSMATFGFWVVHDESIVRVSVSYDTAMAYADRRLARGFPESFHIRD